MQKTLLLLFLLIVITSYSQSETEVAGINYNYFTKSNYYKNSYKSSLTKMDAFINYGHDLGKKSELFYHLSFQNFDYDTKINSTNIPQDDFVLTPNIPNHSLVTLATGMKNKLKNNWNLTNIFSLTFANDIANTNLNSNNYFRTFSFIKKKKSDTFSYGFGFYLDNVKNHIRVLPILTLSLKNKKRGLKLFFPKSLKLWQKLTDKSYLELKSNLDYNTLNHNDFDEFTIEIFSIMNDLTYNYIINNKFKLKAGLGLPYRTYEYKFDFDDVKTTQKTKISFNFGLSYAVFK